MNKRFIFRRTAYSLWLTAYSLLFAYPAYAVTIPDDPLYGAQWYLPQASIPLAWDTTTGSKNVVVAVIDTGVDLDHPDIRANIWRNPREIPGDGVDNDRNGFIDDVVGWNFVENNNNPRPSLAGTVTQAALVHGTLIASIIAAQGNNHEGMAGISWASTIMPLRALASDGQGDAEVVIKAIRYAVMNGANIINLSFTTFDANALPLLSDVIKLAHDRGVIVVAAAGNDETGGGVDLDARPIYPACINGPGGENWVIGVGATDRADHKSRFSHYGSLCVDISAPGEEILGAQFRNDFLGIGAYGAGWAGTSLAAPIIAGTAALLEGIAPDLSRDEIVNILLGTADSIDAINSAYRGKLGRGRVNAAAAVREAQSRRDEIPKASFAVSAEGGTPRVWLFDRNGTITGAFLAYDKSATNGVRLAIGNVLGDNLPEIVTVPGKGGAPEIRVFDENGVLKKNFLAYPPSYRGGLTVAVGDLRGRGAREIVTATGAGVSPSIKVFSADGELRTSFMAFAPNFTGGVEVAVADLDGDGASEIIAVPQSAGGPHVRIFDGDGHLKAQFFALPKTHHAGLRVAAGDVNQDGRADILITDAKPDGVVSVFGMDGSSRATITAYTGSFPNLMMPAVISVTTQGALQIAGTMGGPNPSLRGFNPVGALISAFQLPSELKTSIRVAPF